MTPLARAARLRLSLLGELSPWTWMLAIVVTLGGCESVGLDGVTGSAFVAALGAFGYALRTRVTADARTAQAVIDALSRRDNEIAQLRVQAARQRDAHDEAIVRIHEAHKTDMAQLRLVFEAAVGREQLALKRLNALAEEFAEWRTDNIVQHSTR